MNAPKNKKVDDKLLHFFEDKNMTNDKSTSMKKFRDFQHIVRDCNPQERREIFAQWHEKFYTTFFYTLSFNFYSRVGDDVTTTEVCDLLISLGELMDAIPGSRCPAGSFVSGTTYAITFVGTTNFVSIGATSSTSAMPSVGTIFKASGAGSGTGTAVAIHTIRGKFQSRSIITLLKNFLHHFSNRKLREEALKILLKYLDLLETDAPSDIKVVLVNAMDWLHWLPFAERGSLIEKQCKDSTYIIRTDESPYSFCLPPPGCRLPSESERKDISKNLLMIVLNFAGPHGASRAAPGSLRISSFSFWIDLLKSCVFPVLYPTPCQKFGYFNAANKCVGFSRGCPPNLQEVVVKWLLSCLEDPACCETIITHLDNFEIALEILLQTTKLPVRFTPVIKTAMKECAVWTKGERTSIVMVKRYTSWVVSLVTEGLAYVIRLQNESVNDVDVKQHADLLEGSLALLRIVREAIAEPISSQSLSSGGQARAESGKFRVKESWDTILISLVSGVNDQVRLTD
jgi:hypothetical protein